MNWLTLLFARKYLFSKKSHSVINIISRVSSFAVGIPVAAMIILLSVFNGFSGIVKQMYTAFDPDIEISAELGKNFAVESVDEAALRAIDGVEQISFMLEDNALFQYRGEQTIGILRGVDSLYSEVIPIKELTVRGEYSLSFGSLPQLFVGQGIAYNIGINPMLYDRVSIYVPKQSNALAGLGALLPISNYRVENAHPAGIYALDAETDGQYVIGSIELTRSLFGGEGRASSIAVKCTEGKNTKKIRDDIASLLGDDFSVKTRHQQKEAIYRIMQYEKWGVFFIVVLVMIIASFSVIGSLSMLIIDKRSDIRTLFNIGATTAFVRQIFIKEGMLISMLGSVTGLVLGIAFCLAQQTFGFIQIPAETFLVSSYPVVLKATDIIGVVVVFVAINYIIAKFTVLKMIPKRDLRV